MMAMCVTDTLTLKQKINPAQTKVNDAKLAVIMKSVLPFQWFN